MKTAEVQPQNNSEMSRVIMLGAFSVFLCISLFMSIFAPYPLGLSSIMYGKIKGAVTMSFATLLSLVLAKFLFNDPTILVFLCVSIPVAIGLTEVLNREINPVKGILVVGGGIAMIIVLIISFITSSSNKSLPLLVEEQFQAMEPVFEEYRKQAKISSAENSFEFEALFSQPKVLADMALKSAPAYFMSSIFIMLWVNLFLLLKTRRLSKVDNEYKYNELYLLNFKMPDQCIWLVIVFLGLAGLGEHLGEWYPAIGMTGLTTIGVFYFFQGFGIYLAFLDQMKLRGFLRSILVVLTVLTAYQIIAVIGLADMFVDFKKLMKKNESGE
jgi:hypothetical protein